jgi:hypothetical protein
MNQRAKDGKGQQGATDSKKSQAVTDNRKVYLATDDTEWRWKLRYYVATCLIALTAIFSSLWGVYISLESRDFSDKILKQLEAPNTPLVKFKEFGWIISPAGYVSCENPPTGVTGYIHNPSTIAIRILKKEFKFKYGAMDVPQAIQYIGGPDTTVLAPNESDSFSWNDPEFFSKYFTKGKDLHSPPPPHTSATYRIHKIWT